jgi:hypothetical protein
VPGTQKCAQSGLKKVNAEALFLLAAELTLSGIWSIISFVFGRMEPAK